MSDSPQTEFHNITELLDINIITRNFSLPTHLAKPDGSDDEYNFEIRLDGQLNVADEILMKEMTIDIKILSSRSNLAEFKILFFFKIQDLSAFIEDNEGKPTLTYLLNKWIDNIVLATSRGILYTELRGTALDKAFLPLVDPDNLMDGE